MAINEVILKIGNQNPTSSAGMTMDSESKQIQEQLTNEQRHLKELSSDPELSEEEKAKKRQEVQKQIAELNRKLRLQRMEQREEAEKAKEEQERKAALQEERLNETAAEKQNSAVKFDEEKAEKKEEQKDKIIPIEDVQIMFETGSLLQKERIQGGIQREREGQEGILEAEIKLDKIYGSDTKAKEEELSELREEERFQIEVQDEQVIHDPLGLQPNTKIIIRE